MRNAFFLAVLFALINTFETSFIWSFGSLAVNIPVMVIVGLIIMQRFGLQEGVAWFFALFVLRFDLVSLIICIIGPLFLIRIFSTRSLYALFGFGLISYGLAMVTTQIIFYIFLSVGYDTAEFIITTAVFFNRILFLLPGLYIGMIIVRGFERNILSRVALKNSL